MARVTKYEPPKCGYCQAMTRRKFEPGRGKGTRLQHPRWRVCENGHQIGAKRGRAGGGVGHCADPPRVPLPHHRGPQAQRIPRTVLTPLSNVGGVVGMAQEIRITDSVTGGQKGVKLERYDLMPWAALDQVAKVY